MEDKWSVDKLSSMNYTTWKFKLKHLLIAKELFGYVDGTTTAPANTAEETVKVAYNKNSSKALSHIVLSVSDELLYLITECETAKEAWDKLSKHFERDTLANKMFLKKRYFRSVMSESTSIESHLKNMKDLTNRLAAIKSPIAEEDQVVTLLGSLPESYSTVVTALETQKETPSLEFVQQTLLNEEQKRKEHSSVLASSERNATNPDTALSASRPQIRRQVTCWYCNKIGHVQRFCRERNFVELIKGPHQAKHAVDDCLNTGESAFLAGLSSDSTNESNQRWLIDSGATKHMTPYKSLFSEFTQFDKPHKVEVADGSSVDAIGIGNIKVSTQLGHRVNRKATLSDVLYIPD